MKASSNALATSLSTLESVDPAEASVRLNELQTRMEASYSLTARLQQLSLVKYL
jgi:flagellar hook-associated protein 3 FlgL